MILSQYVKELKKIRMLSREEEEALWLQYKEHDNMDCRSKIIEHYQPLVFKIATGWRLNETVIMDLIQEGTVGLIEAVERFDHQRNVAFSLFASQRIRGRIINYMEKEGKFSIASMDSPLSAQEDLTLRDVLVDAKAGVSSQAEHNYLVAQVKNAMDRLPVKEQAVLSGVFLEDCEPKQLAENLDLSISHIYKLQKQGIRRIRGMLSKFMQHW
ncbi:sigma-70 family RNA polymerase sigma factor [Pelosinus propionicus]|uniref:RNA polymerase sporulation-specific sigma factor n=1 Tax=Pelosinus propionicus DSM 13327 TaxID=1123291 RepID=A0A1I4J6H7_9FIRM|nr:sigma-70 family RNA polymerase sigma factor [Pelosinus propionicus]SFL62198.1 RNA polymerase sporulation-specific sigma factor [Pelosinus propionicus DSM 13327]